jgi:nucleoid-associated protein YgaU
LGDTLWDISRSAYGRGIDWIEIWYANQDIVINPRYIFVDQVLYIPVLE